MAAQRTYPGAGANSALRVFGTLEIICGVVGMLVIWAEFGSTTGAYGYSTVTNPVGVAVAIAVLVQGILIAALFFALAGLGDNLIGIRSELESRPERASTTEATTDMASVPITTAPHVRKTTGAGVSANELSAEMRRRAIRKRAETGNLNVGDAATWSFIVQSEMPEIAPAVLKSLEERSSYNAADAASKLTEYMASLKHETAMDLLFARLPTASGEFAKALVRVARSLELMDFDRAAALLKDGDDETRLRVLQLCSAHCASYGEAEADSMRRFLVEVDQTFTSIPIRTHKVGLMRTKTDMWDCGCGNSVRADLEVCPTCGRDRFGFKPSEWGPAQTKEYLRDRGDALAALTERRLDRGT